MSVFGYADPPYINQARRHYGNGCDLGMTDDLIERTDGRVAAVWYCPAATGSGATLLIEPIAGPKGFRRVWLDLPALSDDWTWHKPENAERIA